MKNALTRFSGLSGHSGSKEYEILAHDLFSFAGWTYEKWMDQQYTDPLYSSFFHFSAAMFATQMIEVWNMKNGNCTSIFNFHLPMH